MNDQPLISVIIPVFNGAQYIKRAVDSIQAQTFHDLEMIVVDDGSVDDTRIIIEPMIKDGVVRYIYQENKGLAAARNTGIRNARGKFLKFLDCDDILYPRQLEMQIDHLENRPDDVLSVTDYELEFESGGKKPNKIRLGKNSQLARFIEANPCPVHTVLVQRSMVERMQGFDEDLHSHEDTDLWLRILLKGGVFEKIDYIGCCYRILHNSKSSNTASMFVQRCKLFEKLNRNFSDKLNDVSPEVRDQLLSSNIRLIHLCFIHKGNVAFCLQETLKTSGMIYGMRANMLRKFLFKMIGIKNVIFLNYMKHSRMSQAYHSNLINMDSSWRDEKSYA